MNILVLSKKPDLYWNVCKALQSLNLQIKHRLNVQAAEEYIFNEVPDIVILKGSDENFSPIEFMNKMRSQIFTHNTQYIVVTSDTSSKFKEELLNAGAGQIFYQGTNFNFSPLLFYSFIKWFIDSNKPNAHIFDYNAISIISKVEFQTDGRLGWISPNYCLIETNIDLAVGQSISVNHPIFDELEMKNVKLKCVSKNIFGRYYNYTNSLLLKLSTQNQIKDCKKIETWILENIANSKRKVFKIVFYESDPVSRENILNLLKSKEVKRYVTRGYTKIDNLEENLTYQIPQLVIINRAMIQDDPDKLKIIQNFIKKNNCDCITYTTSELPGILEFKNNFNLAIHYSTPINTEILDSMIKKIEEKLAKKLNDEEIKFFPKKNSRLSPVNLYASGTLSEFALNDIGLKLPFSFSPLSLCNVSCHFFRDIGINRTQFFRTFTKKEDDDSPKEFYHRMIFIGQNVKEIELIKIANEKIAKLGYEEWLKICAANSDQNQRKD